MFTCLYVTGLNRYHVLEIINQYLGGGRALLAVKTQVMLKFHTVLLPDSCSQ